MDTDLKLKSSLVIVMMIVLVMTAILPLLNMVPAMAYIEEPANETNMEMITQVIGTENTGIEINLYDYFNPNWESYYIDYMGDNLLWKEVGDGLLLVTPKKDWYGSESVIIYIQYVWKDPVAITPYSTILTNAEFLITVEPVNDPPEVIAQGTTVYMTKDSRIDYAFNLYDVFEDVDSDMDFFWMSLNKLVSVEIDIFDNVNIVSNMNDGIKDTITLIAYDGELMATFDMYFEIYDPESVHMLEDTSEDILVDKGDEYLVVLTDQHTEELGILIKDEGLVISPDDNWNGHGDIEILVGSNPLAGIPPDPSPPSLYSAPEPPAIDPPPISPETLGIMDYTSIYMFDYEVEVEAVNDPLTSTDLPVVTIMEDSSLVEVMDLDLYFDDIDSSLSYSAAAGKEVRLTVDNGKISLAPNANWFGTEEITIEGTDGEYTLSENLRVSVQPVNDPPSVSGYAEMSVVEEDGALEFILSDYFSDIDSEMIFTYVADDNLTVELNETTDTVLIIPGENWNGKGNVTVYGFDEDYQALQNFSIMVTPVNDMPVLNDIIIDQSFNEDSQSQVEVGSAFIDVDSELQYSVSSQENNIHATLNDGKLSITSSDDWHGSGIVVLTATDGEYTMTQNIEVVVAAVNDAPVLKPSSLVRIMEEDSALSVDLTDYFSDVDSELSFDVDPIMSIETEIVDNELFLTPDENWNGLADMIIRSSDEQYVIAQSIMIQVQAINDVPVKLKNIPAITFNNNISEMALDINDYFYDVDGDELTITISGSENTEIVTAQDSKVFNIKNKNKASGVEDLQLTVSDGTVTLIEQITVVSEFEEEASTPSSGLSFSDMTMMGGFAITAVALVVVTAAARHRIRTLNKRASRAL